MWNQIGVKLNDTVKKIFFGVMVEMFHVLYEVIREEIDLICISMDFLCESDAPDHGVDSDVRIILSQFRPVEVHL